MPGTALSPLRPAGVASFDGRRTDVVSQGEFIESGEPLEVVRDEGTRVVVKLRRPAAPEGTTE
jgi:membrane-bound serine protease (ClpP class)